MEKLIDYLKTLRKRNYLTNTPASKYAFVGIGNHSINNLYPIINYLKLDLKYIVTRSKKNAQLINDNYPNIIGTNNLDTVLEDDEIQGVFVSASPKSHFNLTKKILKADKNVFIEKPPCHTFSELKELIRVEQSSKGCCFVGLQKQYAPVNLEIKKYTNNKCTYNYRFVTGAYPEGDPFLDIFIHPISLITFLFGETQLSHYAFTKSNGGITLFLTTSHSNNAIGIVELSTEYSWRDAFEKLVVNTEKGIYETTNTEELIFKPKQGLLLGLPKEKIFANRLTSQILKIRNNFNPVFENNQLYTSGYFNEIDNFVKCCEKKKYIKNSSLESLTNTYKLIEEIKI